MAVARGTCPSCGAPIEFSVGSSVAKVCEFCRSTVVRSDRGLEDLGKVAAIANVPSLIAVGDEGTLAGRPMQVLGRVQLDQGAGPWDEWYVAFDHGAAWGWLAYAEGIWYATSLLTKEAPRVPPFDALRVEQDVSLGAAGTFRVGEAKTGRVVSAEGELPAKSPPGQERRYADLHGASDAFATIDYGDGTGPVEIYVGRRFEERDLRITALAPRAAAKVGTTGIRCPNCGGDVPKRSGERAERIGCPYCGAVSDIAAERVVAAQEIARNTPPIPLGARGTLDSVEYVVIAHLLRSTVSDGERYTWDELLLFAEGTGFRWLVLDEGAWLFVSPVNIAELDLTGMPESVRLAGQRYGFRNRGIARVDRVVGEVYWKCEIGEEVDFADYSPGKRVLSREETPGEVHWSSSTPISWAVLSRAFGVPADRAGPGTAKPVSLFGTGNAILTLLVLLLVLFIIVHALDDGGSSGGAFGGGSVGGTAYGGSGWYYGGK
jgi:hypothetical protein